MTLNARLNFVRFKDGTLDVHDWYVVAFGAGRHAWLNESGR